MNRYVILCDCDSTCSGEARHEIAIIDDARLDGPLRLEPNYFPGLNLPPGGGVGGVRVNPNTRGDYRTPFDLRCPCRHTPRCTRELPNVLQSTVEAVITKLAPWREEFERISHYECDEPAGPADDALWHEQALTELTGSYSGQAPVMVPRYASRTVIPFQVFLEAVSQLTKDRYR